MEVAVTVKSFSGKVRSGFGVGSANFANAFTVITQRTGLSLALGTLNVRLLHAYDLLPDGTILASQGNGYEDLHYAACRIVARKSKRSQDALIVRTSTQAKGRSKHGRAILEIAAPVRLREVLELSDGDAVNVELDNHKTLRRC